MLEFEALVSDPGLVVGAFLPPTFSIFHATLTALIACSMLRTFSFQFVVHSPWL